LRQYDEVNCARYGREADLPITLFKTALNPAVTGQVQGAEAVLDLRLKVGRWAARQYQNPS
jgi:transformation/transcription domain-associated protein